MKIMKMVEFLEDNYLDLTKIENDYGYHATLDWLLKELKNLNIKPEFGFSHFDRFYKDNDLIKVAKLIIKKYSKYLNDNCNQEDFDNKIKYYQ